MKQQPFNLWMEDDDSHFDFDDHDVADQDHAAGDNSGCDSPACGSPNVSDHEQSYAIEAYDTTDNVFFTKGSNAIQFPAIFFFVFGDKSKYFEMALHCTQTSR